MFSLLSRFNYGLNRQFGSLAYKARTKCVGCLEFGACVANCLPTVYIKSVNPTPNSGLLDGVFIINVALLVELVF